MKGKISIIKSRTLLSSQPPSKFKTDRKEKKQNASKVFIKNLWKWPERSVTWLKTSLHRLSVMLFSCFTRIEIWVRSYWAWSEKRPFPESSPSNVFGHKHWYPLSVNPDWQLALFWHFKSCHTRSEGGKNTKMIYPRKVEGLSEERN